MATVDKLEIDGVVRDIQDKSLTETVNTLSLDYQETKNKVTDIEGDVAELQEIVGESAVTSVNGKSGAVTLDAEDVDAAPASHIDVTGGENVKGHVKVTTDFSNATDNDVVPSAPAVKTAVNNLQQAINSKSTVPTNHASSDITYGIGTSSNYGHVKVDNTYDKETPEAADGVAASAYALQSAYNELKQRPVGVQSVNGKTGSTVSLNASDVGAAPSNHASPTAGEASPVYGGGTSSQFGHVSLTDVYDNPNTDVETDGAANSKAASAYAVQAMYKEIMESGAGGGTYVEANPTLSGGEEVLTAIQIGAEKFAIEGGGGGVDLSSTEKAIGTWVDGSTLYERVFTITGFSKMVSGTAYEIIATPRATYGIDKLISGSVMIKTLSVQDNATPIYTVSNGTFWNDKYDDVIKFIPFSNLGSDAPQDIKEFYIILTYTKNVT